MSAKANTSRLRDRTVPVTLRGDLVIECRCPDPVDLIAINALPLTVYAEVLETLQQWIETKTGPSLMEKIQGPEVLTWLNFLDRWACAAAVAPQIVMTVEAADGETAIWVDDLDLDDKALIFGQTNRRFKHAPRLRSAVTEFRALQADGAGTGPGGAPVRDAAVGAGSAA